MVALRFQGAMLLVVAGLAAAAAQAAQSGVGRTTRYWDCCKPTCSWASNAGSVTAPVRACAQYGRDTIQDLQAQNGCTGGNAYNCNSQQPFEIDGQLYGFVAANVSGIPVEQMCCSCLKLHFQNTELAGRNMIVQITNTGVDLQLNHFDIAMPAAGMGIFTEGCPKQFPYTPSWAWGAQYGGVSKREECGNIAPEVRPGCYFRFDSFKNANNPDVHFESVRCPEVLTERTGCRQTGDN